jgi:hypothetical protein
VPTFHIQLDNQKWRRGNATDDRLYSIRVMPQSRAKPSFCCTQSSDAFILLNPG